MAHWRKVRSYKKNAVELLHAYALHTGGLPKFTGKVNVVIWRLWGYRQRAWDVENLYGSVKPLIDAMRERKKAGGRTDRKQGYQGGLGIIEDDDPAKLGLTVLQRKNDLEKYLGRLCCQITITGRRVK